MPNHTKLDNEEYSEAAYYGPERRAVSLVMPSMTEEQLEALATRAAEKAIARVTNGIYASVGKAILQKLIWLLGASVIGFIIWFKTKG